MRIALDVSILFHDQVSGVHRVAREITHRLIHRSKHEFTLVGIVPRGKRSSQVINSWSGVKQDIKYVPQRIHRIMSNYAPLFNQYRSKSDVYHNFDGPPLSLGKVNTAMVFDLTPLYHPEWHDKANIQSFKHRLKIIRDYQHLFCISQTTQVELQNHFGDELPSSVITMGNDHIREDDTESKTASAVKPYFLIMGGLNPRKNLLNVLSAYKAMTLKWRSKHSLTVIINAADLNQIPESLSKTQGVNFQSEVSDAKLWQLMRQALALLYPSLYEGFGLPVIEAMRLSTLVITSDKGGLIEAGGNHAFYVDPYDPEDIARTLIQVSRLSTSQKDNLIRDSQRYSRKFAWDKATHELQSTWERLIKG